MKTIAMMMAAMLASPGLAKDAPPEPSTTPDWAQVRQRAEALIKADMFDPASAQIEWTRGFSWAYTKEAALLPKKYGWIGCYRFNAKNRMGGYVGFERGVAVVQADGRIRLDYTSHTDACENWTAHTPLQPALVDTPPSTAVSSVADELAKLADLRARGILSPAEFDAQKARLLAR